MKFLEKLKAAYAAMFTAMKAITDTAEADGGRALTDEEQTSFDDSKSKLDALGTQIVNQEAIVKATAEAARQGSIKAPVLARQLGDAGNVDLDAAKAAGTQAALPIEIPASAQRFAGRLRAYTGPKAVEEAYTAGQWFMAISGNATSAQWCADHGMALTIDAGQIEGDNAKGGYLVPDVIENRIIRLVESYGQFRRKAHVVPMTSETSSTNRRTGGVIATFAGEGVAATKSTMSWDQVTLVAKKLTAITCISDELDADAMIKVGDSLTVEIALAFATKEDACGYNGTGTAAFGKIVGIRTKLVTINGVDEGGGLVLGTASTWSGLTLGDFNRVKGRTPNYDGPQNEEWTCSKPFFEEVMGGIKYAGGGNAVRDIEGGNGHTFLGYPVNISNSYPKATAVSQVSCTFGDVNLSSSFGDRKGMTISMSREATVDGVSMFETGQIAIKGTERFDINNHDLGDATNAGAVVGLITKAS